MEEGKRGRCEQGKRERGKGVGVVNGGRREMGIMGRWEERKRGRGEEGVCASRVSAE